jgi:hypothetical protein
MGGETRVRAAGKFLFAGAEKLYVRGVTYGTFRPGAEDEYPKPARLEADFALLAANATTPFASTRRRPSACWTRRPSTVSV